MKSLVSVVKSEYHDALPNLRRALDILHIDSLRSNSTVILKINICDARMPDTGAITHPLFLDAVLNYLRSFYDNLRIIVVESDATVVLADRFIKWFGYIPILEKWNAEFINLSKQRVVNKTLNGRYFKEIPVPEILDQGHFFITVPKLKTNPMPTITCCLKNQFGCFARSDKNVYHPFLDDVIADVNKALHPDLCLVDGVIAMGGTFGPAFGVPVRLKAIICSPDPVATDAYGAKLMGFNPRFIGHITKSAASGVGSMSYELKGDTLPKVNFEINKLETFLVNKVGTYLQKRSRKEFRKAGGKSK
ncbi:MAG: DUF362 domain-containing protein [Dehalococcoidales bacterium]|nr:DUF362 domain-containing protein [Dehalococcoidales bacterium]